jgi:hypothetical protein
MATGEFLSSGKCTRIPVMMPKHTRLQLSCCPDGRRLLERQKCELISTIS